MDPIEVLLFGGLAYLVWTMIQPSIVPESVTQIVNDTTGGIMGKTYSAAVMAVAHAINIAEEGGKVDQRTHNPGNLKNGDMGFGLWNGITIYGSDEQGWDALYHKIDNILSGNSSVYDPNWSISQIAQKYTATEQQAWANNVARTLGVTPDTTLADAAAQVG